MIKDNKTMLDISVIIMTFNEEIHIKRCIGNARKFAKEIFVVDSYSTDKTVEIATGMGARVFRNKWVGYSHQFNWALDNLPIKTEWIWRMDADEYLSEGLINELRERLPRVNSGVNGFTAPCLRIFMGRYIKHGIVPLILLRLFRNGFARCENRLMDEHLQVTGGVVENLKGSFYDHNLNGLTWWTTKHNRYATREAVDLLMTEYGLIDSKINSGSHANRVRKGKLMYMKMPLFFRAFAFFIYRYFLLFGFLDGKEGFLWHFLQGWWYRTLADAKVYEIKKRFHFDNEKIKSYLRREYGV